MDIILSSFFQKINIFDDSDQQSEQNNEEKNIKELLIGGGAGCACFLIGYMQGLMEIVGKEVLKQYKLGSVSCGTAIAGYLLICLHSDKDLKYFYLNHLRKFWEKDNRKYFGLLTNGKLVKESAIEAWQMFKNNNIEINGIFHCTISRLSGLFFLEKQVADEFQNEEDFSEAIEASCTLPIITKLGIFSLYQNVNCLDGGFTASIPYKYEHSQKIFINLLPKMFRKWPIVQEQPKNLKCLDITENENIKFPFDYLVWDEHWADEMYLKGYLAAKKNMNLIKETFEVK